MSFLMELKFGVIRDVNSNKMPNSITAVEVLMEGAFFVFMFFLEFLIEQTCTICDQSLPS